MTHRGRVKLCLMTIALGLAAPAIAQAIDQAGSADCKAEEAALERDIDLARARGQMLHRQQLDEALVALKTRCETLAPEQSRAAHIRKLEAEIRELRLELDRAEEQLRKLKAERP
jgi:hypothetical protein